MKKSCKFLREQAMKITKIKIWFACLVNFVKAATPVDGFEWAEDTSQFNEGFAKS